MEPSGPLLERDAELAILGAALARARDGHGALIRVRGPAGVGKSSLLAAVADDAVRRGFVRLDAAGAELEREFGFGIARQLFERPLGEATPDVRNRLLEGPAGLASPLLGLGSLSAAALTGAQIADLFYALYWLAVNLAEERPVLLVVDDLQNADEASLRFLGFLARRVEDSPLLALVAQRSTDELATPIEEALAPVAMDLALAPLSADATEKLTVETLGGADVDAELAAACWRSSGGNPQLLHELLTTLRAEGVEPGEGAAERVAALAERHVARAVVVRLGLLSTEDRRLATAVAVLDGKARLPDVARLAELTAEDAARGLDRLQALGVASRGEPARVAHALVGEAILEELAPSQRSALGRAAARVLDEAGAEEELVAAHLLRADPAGDPWVIARLRSAARSEMSRGAPSAAVALLERAAREGGTGNEQGEILFELGQANMVDAPTRAAPGLLAAVRLLSDPGARVGGCVLVARSLVVQGDVPGAIEVLQEAIDVHAPEVDGDIGVLLEAELTGAARLDTRTRQRALQGLATLEEALPAEGFARRVALAVLAGERGYHARPASETRELALEALGDGALLAESGPEAPVFYVAAFALLLADDPTACLAQFDAALAETRNQRSIAVIPRACRAVALLRLGRAGEAEVEARTALDVLIEQDEVLLVPLTVAALVDALLWRGATKEAREVLTLPGLSDGVKRSGSLYSHFLVRRAKLAVADGDDEEALNLLIAAGHEEQSVGCENPAATEWRSEAAIVALRLGRTKLATELAESNLRDARTIGGPRMCGIAERVQALVGPPSERLERLERSAELLLESGDPVQRAVTLIEAGEASTGARQRPVAREQLREALDIAQRCGATAVADRAREAYSRAGGRLHRERMSGPMALTPSERRVCELAAEGATNVMIAQELFLTRKTVEGHLSVSYRKLGINGRGELADSLEPELELER